MNMQFDSREPIPSLYDIEQVLGIIKHRTGILPGDIWNELSAAQWGVKNYPDKPCGRHEIITILAEPHNGRYCMGSDDTSLQDNPRHFYICSNFERCHAHRHSDGRLGSYLYWIIKGKDCPWKRTQIKMEGL